VRNSCCAIGKTSAEFFVLLKKRELNRGFVMFNDEMIRQMRIVCRRVFAMPITRTTFRELQSALMSVTQIDQESFKMLMESFLTGKVLAALEAKGPTGDLQGFINEYSIQGLVAKDVHDRGDFVNFISSDVLSQPNRLIFSNCIKTIDGKEHNFLTDIETMVSMTNHMVGRLQEANNTEVGKEVIKKQKNELLKAKALLDKLLASTPSSDSKYLN
jgi:hypothetical protein